MEGNSRAGNKLCLPLFQSTDNALLCGRNLGKKIPCVKGLLECYPEWMEGEEIIFYEKEI